MFIIILISYYIKFNFHKLGWPTGLKSSKHTEAETTGVTSWLNGWMCGRGREDPAPTETKQKLYKPVLSLLD